MACKTWGHARATDNRQNDKKINKQDSLHNMKLTILVFLENIIPLSLAEKLKQFLRYKPVTVKMSEIHHKWKINSIEVCNKVRHKMLDTPKI